MTIHEAAACLGVSRRRIRQLIEQGRLTAEKHGRDWWIHAADLAHIEPRPRGRPKKETPS